MPMHNTLVLLELCKLYELRSFHIHNSVVHRLINWLLLLEWVNVCGQVLNYLGI